MAAVSGRAPLSSPSGRGKKAEAPHWFELHPACVTISNLNHDDHVMQAKSFPGGLVYSTEGGRMCPGCRQPVVNCQCRTAMSKPATDGIVRVSRETKGRAGKGVTLVKGLALDKAALEVLGKQLKAACGSGGTMKDGVIEVQGDHCVRVMTLLQAQGYKVKRAGG